MLVDLPVVAPGTAIYEHIRRSIGPAGRLADGTGLPDDDKVMSEGLRWVPGAMDGITTHNTAPAGVERAASVAGVLSLACRRPSVRNLRRLYTAVAEDDVADYADALVEGLSREPDDRQALHAIGRWLATTAPDRGPVKLGVVLLGVAGSAADLPVLRTLGAHEEFTLFCAAALSNALPDPERELWALAMSVDGWGRIHCVERLRDTANPAVRAWLLREGFRNSIMYEYLAHVAATAGGLLEALRGRVDRELLTAAGEILVALITGGPAEDIDDYEAGADAVEEFLSLMATRAGTLRDFSAVATIRTFLAGADGWEERGRQGWTATRRQAFEDACDEILSRDSWHDHIATGLASPDRVEFFLAQEAAQIRGMDTFDVHVAKIKADPLGHHWFEAWRQADTHRAGQLVELARIRLPIEEIATGVGDESGLGVRWRPHHALNWTLQALRDHPGLGGDLVLAGLRSPVTGNRNMALKALSQWPRNTWPPTAPEAVDHLARTDPHDSTRELAAVLAARET